MKTPDSVRTLEGAALFLQKNYPQVTHGLLSGFTFRSMDHRMCAIRRDGGSGRFVFLDRVEEDRSPNELWLPWDQIGAEPPRLTDPRDLRQEKSCPKEEHEGYQYFQPNPLNNSVGDCVIRAYAAVFDVSWDDALEMVASSVEYTTTRLNSNYVYRYLTSEYGMIPQKPQKIGRHVLKGQQLCGYLSAMYHNGERIFADCGSSHVVGIVPVDTPAGTRYVIRDSWDSSQCLIGEYFVLPKEKQKIEEPEMIEVWEPPKIQPGARFLHPRYGEGTIESLQDGKLVALFEDGCRKTLTVAWVEANCTTA